MKVHVHTNDPGAVLSYLGRGARFFDVHISNMEEQTSERRAGIDDDAAGRRPKKALGVVAVAAGSGIVDIMRSLGVDEVVPGGQSMNPSIGEITQAVRAAGARHVIVLPNNRNVIAAAQQAAEAAAAAVSAGNGDDREPVVHVVPTRTVPEGLAALIVYDRDGKPEDVARRMELEVGRVTSGAVTRAVRDSRSAAGDIKSGDVIGVTDHEILVVGSAIHDVTADLAASLAQRAGQAETLTLLAGEELADDDAERIADILRRRLPDLEVEWHRGDQPLYPVLIGLE